MAFIRIFQPPANAEIYDKVNAAAGVEQDPPAGLLFHCAGEVDGKWQIIDAWESEADAQRFDDERLGPALEQVMGGRPPEGPPTTKYELYSVVRP